MSIDQILKFAMAVVSVVTIVAILLQVRSGGIGSVFGGVGGESYRSKRGTELFMYNLTIFCGILLALIAIAIAIVNV